MANTVDHPDHYKAGNLEVIDIIEEFGLDFHLGNAIKYILRAGRKTEDPVEDLEKAVWYIHRFLDRQVSFALTDYGKEVLKLKKAGVEVPFAEKIAFVDKYGTEFVWTGIDNWISPDFDGAFLITDDVIRHCQQSSKAFIKEAA